MAATHFPSFRKLEMRPSTSGFDEKVVAPGPPPGRIRMSKFVCAAWEGSERREGKSGMMRMLRVRLLVR